MTESDVPLLVDRCIDYITQCGMGQVLGCWQGPEHSIQVTPLVCRDRLRSLHACDVFHSLPEGLLQLCGRAPSLAGLWLQSLEHLQDGIFCGTWQCLMGSWWARSGVCRGGLIPTGSITGLTSEGIYRKSGQNSKTTSLLEVLQRDARRVRLKEGEHQVDDVANTLKRFFRDLGDGLFTRRWAPDWLWATSEPWGLLGGGRRRGIGPSSV